MLQTLRNTLGRKIVRWLTKSVYPSTNLLTDYECLKQEIQPGDILLVEGDTRVGHIIQLITRSRWSHSAIYVGGIDELECTLPVGADTSALKPKKGYLVEAELGLGTVLADIDKYENYRVRVCRPIGISEKDKTRVVCYVLSRLGTGYNIRQLTDLARFLFPYGILPWSWRSTLFQHNAGEETKIVCSTLIADAYQAVDFPVMPIESLTEDGKIRLFKRNSRLFAPADFDVSPFFDVIKFPAFSIYEQHYYRSLPWAEKNHELPAKHDIEMAVHYKKAEAELPVTATTPSTHTDSKPEAANSAAKQVKNRSQT